MSPDDLALRLRAGAELALDTNAIFGFRTIGTLASLIREANRARPDEPPIRLLVPVLVHAEILHDLRCFLAAKGHSYRPEEVVRDLEGKGVEIVEFAVDDAEGVSAHLYTQHTTEGSWRAAKRLNAIAHLGLLKEESSIPGQRVPATVDWFIAGQALRRGWLLVTADRGPEFRGLTRVQVPALKAALTTIARPPGGPSPG